MADLPQKLGLVWAVVNAVLVGLTVAASIWANPAWFASTWTVYAGMTLPATWLLAAGVLSRSDPGPIRWAVVVAAAVSLAINLPKVDVVLARFGALPPGPPVIVPTGYSAFTFRYTSAVGPVSLTALVPAVVGWRQRRRDRLAADADA